MYAFILSQNAMLGDIFKPRIIMDYTRGWGHNALKRVVVVNLSEIILASVVWSIVKAWEPYHNQILRPKTYFKKNSHKEKAKIFSMFLYIRGKLVHMVKFVPTKFTLWNIKDIQIEN